MDSNIYKGSFPIIPKDVLKNEPILHIVGINRIHIENHCGIIEYNLDKVRVDSKRGIIIITGKELFIREIDKYTIIVLGKIDNISYAGGA